MRPSQGVTMTGDATQLTLSILSLAVAAASAIFAFYSYWSSRSNLQKYDLEISYLGKQIKYNAFFEIRKSIDDLNNKMIEWDVNLPILGGQIKFDNLDDRKKAIIFLHRINIFFYAIQQKDLLGDSYVEFFKKWIELSLFNAAKGDEITKKMMDIVVKLEGSDPAELELNNILRKIKAELTDTKSKLN